MKVLAIMLLIVVCIGTAVAWEMWRWGECRQVGHGVMYCLFYR